MTNKTFQDILIEQLEAAAELGNADAMYQLFLNEKMCRKDPSKADEDRAEEYLEVRLREQFGALEGHADHAVCRWGLRWRDQRESAGESGDLRPGAKPPDWRRMERYSSTLLMIAAPNRYDRWAP